MSDALAEFIDDLELQGRHGTASTYRRTLATLRRRDLASVALLTTSLCRELVAERVRATSGNTAATFHAILRSFCRWCVVDRRYLLVNPTDGVPKPKQRRPPHRWLTPPQLRAMYLACKNDGERLIMLLCGGAGLRAQELLTLKFSGVDFARGEIRVLGKGQKWRTLRPGELAMKLLCQVRGDNIGSGFVMPWRSSTNLGYHVDELAKRAGVAHCHPHMLRHSFAVNYLQADGSALGLQQLLGHTDSAMTQYYVRDAAAELARNEQARVGLADRLFGD